MPGRLPIRPRGKGRTPKADPACLASPLVSPFGMFSRFENGQPRAHRREDKEPETESTAPDEQPCETPDERDLGAAARVAATPALFDVGLDQRTAAPRPSASKRTYDRPDDARRHPDRRPGRSRAREKPPGRGIRRHRRGSRRRLRRERAVVALTIPDREAILRALDDPSDGLAELRGVLLREREWRKRVGLA